MWKKFFVFIFFRFIFTHTITHSCTQKNTFIQAYKQQHNNTTTHNNTKIQTYFTQSHTHFIFLFEQYFRQFLWMQSLLYFY